MLRHLYEPDADLEIIKGGPVRTISKYKTCLWHLIQNVRHLQGKQGEELFTLPKEITDAFTQTEKKFQRTLQRLKDKGIYVATLNDLYFKIAETTGFPLAFVMSFLPGYSLCSELIESGGAGEEIADEAWFSAIEIVVARFSPDMIDDNVKNYAAIVEQHIDDLYAYVSMCHFLLMYVATWSEKQFGLPFDPLGDIPAGHRVDIQDMEMLESENQRLKKKVEKLTSDYDDLNAIYQKTTKEVTQVRSQLRAEEADRELTNQYKLRAIESERNERKLSARVEELSDDNERLKEMLAKLESEPDPALKTDSFPELPDVELPEENVIFLGGHVNLINKLRRIYPNWTYLNDADGRSSITDRTCTFLVSYSSNVSHSLRAKVQSFFATGTAPVIYASATNVDMLVNEIKQGYLRILSEQEEK